LPAMSGLFYWKGKG